MLNRKRRLAVWSLQSVVGIAVGIIVVFPVVWIILTSLKQAGDMFRLPITILPQNPTLQNYVEVLGKSKFARYFLNSLIVTVSATLINLVVAVLAAYAVDRFGFKGRKLFLGSVMLTQVMPVASVIIPIYQLWTWLGLIDTYPALIATQAISTIPLTLWLMVGFFSGIPKELDEAGAIDGCGRMMTLWRILLPLLKPAVFAAAIYVSLQVWQEFMMSMTLVTSENMRTLMFGLYSFVGEKLTNWGPLMAASVITTIPVIIFFTLTQKHFVNGVTGAVKG